MIINNLTLKNLYKKEQANPTGKRFEITYGGGLGLRVSKKGKFTRKETSQLLKAYQ